MKNMTLNILMLILLLTAASAVPVHAALVNTHWSAPADNISGDPNEPAPEPEFIKCLGDNMGGDPNEPEPEPEPE